MLGTMRDSLNCREYIHHSRTTLEAPQTLQVKVERAGETGLEEQVRRKDLAL